MLFLNNENIILKLVKTRKILMLWLILIRLYFQGWERQLEFELKKNRNGLNE